MVVPTIEFRTRNQSKFPIYDAEYRYRVGDSGWLQPQEADVVKAVVTPDGTFEWSLAAAMPQDTNSRDVSASLTFRDNYQRWWRIEPHGVIVDITDERVPRQQVPPAQPMREAQR